MSAYILPTPPAGETAEPICGSCGGVGTMQYLSLVWHSRAVVGLRSDGTPVIEGLYEATDAEEEQDQLWCSTCENAWPVPREVQAKVDWV